MTPNKEKAIFIANKLFADFVFDLQGLGRLPFSFIDVQTYLHGITVGGYPVSTIEKLEQHKLAWETLIHLVKSNKFKTTKAMANKLHDILCKISLDDREMTSSQRARANKTNQESLKTSTYRRLLKCAMSEGTTIRQAYKLCIIFSTNNFYPEGNKRTGILMMNGMLLSNGYSPFTIPHKLIKGYTKVIEQSNDSKIPNKIFNFLTKCHLNIHNKFI